MEVVGGWGWVVRGPFHLRPRRASGAQEAGSASGLHVVNLTYDAMPAEYITMIITEFGMIPPTSVPVIIREYRKEPGM